MQQEYEVGNVMAVGSHENQQAANQEPGATILVVDDNEALLRSVARLLRMEEYGVLLATGGEEALALLEQADTLPDLIVSDIAMPGMDGFDFYRQVRQRPGWLRVPFIFLTARDQMEDLETGYSLGADDYLIKPLDQDRLLLIIRSKIARARAWMREIERLRQSLSSAQRTLSTMVAHELRTPLVSITMVSDMLAHEFDRLEPDQIRDMLDMMQHGSVRMYRLVEQMVLYVQLQSGVLGDDISNMSQPVPVGVVVQDAVARAQQWDYRRRQVAIRVEMDAPEALLCAEKIALVHALAEVLHNGIMLAPVESTILLEQTVQDGMLRITVTDQGAGIPGPEQMHVFDPFYQVDRKNLEQQGIGIGLTLTRSIVDIHNGSVQLESQPGAGTRVIIRLPLLDEGADD